MEKMVHFGLKLDGWFTVELIDAKSGLIKRRLEFKNTITDAGLDILGNSTTGFGPFMAVGTGYCAVGTDSTTPATSQTTLGAEVAPASSNRTATDGASSITSAYVTGPPDYWSYTRTWLFVEAQANGNLTEVGIFTANTSGNMFTRQLFKDGGGTPTTVVKTSADQLRVAYTLRIQPPQSDATPTTTISAVSYDITMRASEASNSAMWGNLSNNNWWAAQQARALETQTLGSRTSSPSGTRTSSDTTTVAAYSNGNYYRDITHKWEPGTSNYATGIGSIVLFPMSNNHLFQASFNPKFSKDNTKRLTLIVRVSWARV